MLAVAQHCGSSGADLLRGLAAAYEIQVDLVKGICLHEHKIDHIAHLGPSAAAGIGALLGLPTETIYQAVQQALHVTTTTRQSRKGEISSWKAYAPAFAGKMAIEAVDRAMRGEGAPSPIYEGEDGFIAWLLGGPNAEYTVPLPEQGEPKRAILDTYTKEHSAEYQSQALIDLARRHGAEDRRPRSDRDIVIHTSHHTHFVIGTGANDPQKMDPKASRETLDHSIMYIFAVALKTAAGITNDPMRPTRAARPDTIELWRKISTVEDPGMDAALSQPRPDSRKLLAAASSSRSRTARHRGRDRCSRRASARRPSLQAAGLHPEIPDAGGRRHCARRAGPLHRRRRAAAITCGPESFRN